MIVWPGLRRSVSAISRLFNSASFAAPLTHSAIPTRAASGTTGTFTRATTSTWPNNDGYMVTGVAGEIGFVGARRIYNKLTNTGWSGAASGTYGTVPTGWTADVGTGTLTVASSATYTGHNQITFTATAQRPFIRLAVAVAAYSVNILSVRVVENASGEPINDIITGSSVPAGSTETYSVNGSTVAASYVPIAGASVTVAYTGTAGTTAALNKNATSIRVMSTTDCFIEIGTNPTAVANTGLYLPALVPEYFTCPANVKVSAIRVASDGNLYVTPFGDEPL